MLPPVTQAALRPCDGGDVLRSVERGRHAEDAFLDVGMVEVVAVEFADERRRSRMTNTRWDSPMISGMSDDA